MGATYTPPSGELPPPKLSGFQEREGSGWKCSHCGSDTHEPEKHASRCTPTLVAKVAELKTLCLEAAQVIEHLAPPPPDHICGPNTFCDYSCQEAADIAKLVANLKENI